MFRHCICSNLHQILKYCRQNVCTYAYIHTCYAKRRRKKMVPYMENKSPSNWLCLQPNFPWHALNSECKAACVFERESEWVRASEYACLSKYLLTPECAKCTWSDWELTVRLQRFEWQRAHAQCVLALKRLLTGKKPRRILFGIKAHLLRSLISRRNCQEIMIPHWPAVPNEVYCSW